MYVIRTRYLGTLAGSQAELFPSLQPHYLRRRQRRRTRPCYFGVLLVMPIFFNTLAAILSTCPADWVSSHLLLETILWADKSYGLDLPKYQGTKALYFAFLDAISLVFAFPLSLTPVFSFTSFISISPFVFVFSGYLVSSLRKLASLPTSLNLPPPRFVNPELLTRITVANMVHSLGSSIR